MPNACSRSRRDFLRATGALGLWAGLSRLAPVYAQTPHEGHDRPASSTPAPPGGSFKTVELEIGETKVPIGDRTGRAITVNGMLPAPLLRFREGDEVELRVTNRLKESASIHWHGVLVPAEMDGVPGISFKGIEPGETFVYRFQLKQYGTYWYHSHSGMHAQLGQYGPIIIDPAHGEHIDFARDHVVVLSDWTFADPHLLFAKLKKQSNFSNLQRRTAIDFFADAREKGLKRTWSEWGAWSKMRMDPTDIADLTGANFTFLMNGRPAMNPWTGIFQPGERVRLRFINAAATTHYDVRIPGLKMTVIEVDGQHVRPVEVDEFRMGAAETYDVLVEPTEDQAYTLFAETTDRSGYALGTLAPREGMRGPVPPRRKRPIRTMADMGMGGHEMGAGHRTGANPEAMDHSLHHGMPPSAGSSPAGNEHPMHGAAAATGTPDHSAHAGHDSAPAHAASHGEQGASPPDSAPSPTSHGEHGDHGGGQDNMPGASGGMAGDRSKREMPKNRFGPGNSMMAMSPVNRAHEPGTGLGEDGRRVLVYRDLVALHDRTMPEPGREIVMHVTGNMERFIWGFDGKKFSEAEPVRLRFGERVRITFINDTMMEHPLHLHGMFMELENGAEGLPPLKHTVTVKPGEKISVLVTADARGHWAFHCHLQYHMEAGMFRVFEVA